MAAVLQPPKCPEGEISFHLRAATLSKPVFGARSPLYTLILDVHQKSLIRSMGLVPEVRKLMDQSHILLGLYSYVAKKTVAIDIGIAF